MVCVVGKMAKDVGMGIHKSIVALFLPCLVTFGDLFLYVAVPGRKRTLFRRVFQSHPRFQSAISQNFH